MKGSLKVDLSIYHKKDWTVMSEGIQDFAIRSDFYISNKLSNFNIEVLSMIGGTNRVESFIGKMKSYKPASNSSFTWELISSDRLYLKGSYKNSIRRLVYDNGGLIKRLFIVDGIEKYTIFFVGERNLENFYQSLSNVALIKHISEEVLSMKETNELLFPNLTADEINILSYSLRNGFFDSPRKLDMTGLKDNFNKSKSTLNYHLRKGIKKILNTYLMDQ
jgi:predicted DNA binding protein